VFLKLILNLLFVFVLKLGVEGIALSTAVTAWAIFFIMLAALKTRLGELPIRIELRETGLVILSVAAASAGTKVLWNQAAVYYGDWLLIGMCSAFFFLSYMLSGYVFKAGYYLKVRALLVQR